MLLKGQFEEHLHQQVHISLYVYYGGCRKKDLRLLREQDVVITTYSTLASDFKVRIYLKLVNFLTSSFAKFLKRRFNLSYNLRCKQSSNLSYFIPSFTRVYNGSLDLYLVVPKSLAFVFYSIKPSIYSIL